MTPKRKTILLILAVLSIVSIVFITLSTKKQESNGIKEDTSATPLSPQYKGEYSIEIIIPKNEFNNIDSLPTVQVSSTKITLDQSKIIGKNLGFEGEPNSIEDAIDGTTYFWTNSSGAFFVYPNKGKMIYSSNSTIPSQDKKLSDTEISSIAIDFLLNNGIFSQDSIVTGPVKYLKTVSLNKDFEEVSKEKSDLYEVDILPRTSSHEIISQKNTQTTTYIQIMKDGSIHSFQILLLNITENSDAKYVIKNYDEIINSLPKATLISLDGVEQPLGDVKGNLVRSIAINKIDINYLFENNNSSSLEPIYKLTGVATLSNSSKVTAILYLPAVSEN